MNTAPSSFRMRVRIGLVSTLAAVLVLGTVGPAQAQEAPTGTGTSTLTIVPGSLDISGLPVDVDATLGTLFADATNTGDPVARLALADLGAAGQKAPVFGVSSADGNQSGSENRSVSVAGVGADLGLVDYLVESGSDSAVASLSALAAEITTPLGLGTDVAGQGLGASATTTDTASSVLLNITGLELGLGDLLPADVLNALPLGVVLGLIDTLGLPLSGDLLGQIEDLQALLGTLRTAVDAGGELAEVQAAIDAVPGLTDLLAQIDPDLTFAQVSASALPSVPLLDDTLDEVLQEIEDGGSLPTIDDPELLALADDLADAQALLDDLLAQIDALLAALDLDALLGDLLDAITGTPLLALGSIELSLDSVADGTASAGTVTCTASGLEVLGTAIPTPSCDAVGAALDGLAAAIHGALSVLPVTAPVPAVTASGLDMESSGAGTPDADGVSTAFARVTALSLDIAPVELTSVVDGLVAELEGLIADLDALVAGLDVPDVGLLQASAVTVPSSLGEALGELQAVLDALPTGGALDGLSTLGVNAVLGAAETRSTFTSATGPGTPGAPGTPGTPGSPTPGSLPNTGADSHTLLMAAIAALAAGGVMRTLGRTTALGMLRVPTSNRSTRLG